MSFSDPRDFIKVHLERSRPLEVSFGIFGQIWSLPVDLIWQKFDFGGGWGLLVFHKYLLVISNSLKTFLKVNFEVISVFKNTFIKKIVSLFEIFAIYILHFWLVTKKG